MKITIDISEADIVALNDHIIRTVPSIRRRLRVGWLLLTGLFSLSGLWLYATGNSGAAIPPAIGSLIVFVGWFPYLRFCRRLNVRRLLRTGSNRAIFGQQVVEITPDEIIRRNEYGHSANYWTAIDRVEVGEEHAFIFVSSMNAIVIPKCDVNRESFEQFVETAEKYLLESDQRR